MVFRFFDMMKYGQVIKGFLFGSIEKGRRKDTYYLRTLPEEGWFHWVPSMMRQF